MKYVIIVIYILLLTVYGYSAHMTSVDPDNNLWGYICTLIFTILAILSFILYEKYSKNTEKDSEDPENP
jgi:quinol-cytochrome oxidoreductase complex cytochrome b subunit